MSQDPEVKNIKKRTRRGILGESRLKQGCICTCVCMPICACAHMCACETFVWGGRATRTQHRTWVLSMVHPEAPGSLERHGGPFTVRFKKLCLNFPNHQGEYCGYHLDRKELWLREAVATHNCC